MHTVIANAAKSMSAYRAQRAHISLVGPQSKIQNKQPRMSDLRSSPCCLVHISPLTLQLVQRFIATTTTELHPNYREPQHISHENEATNNSHACIHQCIDQRYLFVLSSAADAFCHHSAAACGVPRVVPSPPPRPFGAVWHKLSLSCTSPAACCTGLLQHAVECV